jgi:hypothetical protein
VKSVVKNQSIKNNKLCKTNPISGEPKMSLNHYATKNYNNKSDRLTPAKQSQFKPNQSQFSPNQSQFSPNSKPKQTQSNPTCSELVEPILTQFLGGRQDK